MPSYQTDREWSDQYIDEIRRIVGPHLLQNSPFEVDTKQATDLILMYARAMMIACRIRRPGYESSYPYHFTIRSRRDSGARTELEKITNGWADWMFYAHASKDNSPTFSRWYLINLHSWRAALIRDRKSILIGQKPNDDGTHFEWYDLRTFPKEPSIIVASSHTVELKTKEEINREEAASRINTVSILTKSANQQYGSLITAANR